MASSAITRPNTVPTKTCSAISRGERLYPARSSRIYWVLTRLRETYVEFISRYVDGDKVRLVVDYGCGNMPYRRLFDRFNIRYVGCDFQGNELSEIHISADGKLPLSDDVADIILSSQVLEHVADPNEYLAEAHRVLRTGGYLFLSTHGVWPYHPDPYDYWRWTCDGLRRIVGNSGFEVIELRGILSPQATALQLWQDATLRRVPRLLRNIFTRFLQWRIRLADKRSTVELRDNDASVYVIVAKCK